MRLAICILLVGTSSLSSGEAVVPTGDVCRSDLPGLRRRFSAEDVATVLATQAARVRCEALASPGRVARRVTELQEKIVRALTGWTLVTDADFYFRVLISESGTDALWKKKTFPKKTPADRIQFARQLYGGVHLVREVPIFGSEIDARKLEAQVNSLCAAGKPCRFWDSRILQRVLLVPAAGVAAVSADTQSLVLSQNLFYSDLGRWVVVHELAHLAAEQEEATTGRLWEKEFSEFSGWNTPGMRAVVLGERKDAFAEMATRLGISFLPDPVLRAQAPDGSWLDGFVAAKAYRESLARGDAEEDLADHIAAFVVAKDRFCFRAEAVAPRKWAWISREVFQSQEKLDCVGK